VKSGGGTTKIENFRLLRLPLMQGLRLLAIICVAATGGCGDSSMHDLDAYVAEVLARKGWPIEPPPAIAIPPSHVYESSDRRDPFRPTLVAVDEDKRLAETGPTDKPRPPEDRNREELESFPLDALKMAGTLEQGDEKWAIVLGPEGTVYRVKKGNYVGRNYGKIHSIMEDRIELTEIIPNGQGGWQEREAALALVDQ
jgi:type IV pilus assembly protein PilP